MTRGQDEPDVGIPLRLGHHRIHPAPPFVPGRAGIRLRIGDEADGSDVEPSPVLPTAAEGGCAHRGLSVGDGEPALVVAEVVEGRVVPLVVAPDRHVGGRLAPHHDVVEVLVHDVLPVVVAVRQVPGGQHDVRVVLGDLLLGWKHLVVAGGVADVADRVEAERVRLCRGERSVRPASDGVVVRGAGLEPDESRLPERPGGREEKWGWGLAYSGGAIRAGQPVADVVRRPPPVEDHGGGFRRTSSGPRRWSRRWRAATRGWRERPGDTEPAPARSVGLHPSWSGTRLQRNRAAGTPTRRPLPWQRYRTLAPASPR